jgi:hypothetical protein
MNKDSYSVRLDKLLQNISKRAELYLLQQELIFEPISVESIFADANNVLSWCKVCVKINHMNPS